jgi:cob(I)alamin adenosyltransferase
MNKKNTIDRILLFTGEGKGKTTAALGVALRAAGHGMNIGIISFIKQSPSIGEKTALQRFPTVTFELCGKGFLPLPTDRKFGLHKQAAGAALKKAEKLLANPKIDCIILDEVCVAIAEELIDESAFRSTMRKKSGNKIIVLTGRNAPQWLIEMADTVSEIRCIKHGLAIGKKAQPGVEF